MRPLILFGTLGHKPLFEAVLGGVDHLQFVPSSVPGYAVYAVAEDSFPAVVEQPQGKAEGIAVFGLTQQDWDLLNYYEAVLDHAPEQVTLSDGINALAYFPEPSLWTQQGDWNLSNWVQDYGIISLLSAREIVLYHGQKTPEEVRVMLPMIRARAWSAHNASQSLHGALTLDGEIQIPSQERIYAKYFALDEYVMKHQQFDGSMSPEVSRAVFLAPDAALVLPYDPVRDRVLLVEQIRMGPIARGDRTLWQLEPIAGRLDPGETAQDAARREALEEAGLTMGSLEPVAETYCSPGNSSEFYYIFVGYASLPDEIAGVGGLDAEDEDIKSHVLSFDTLLDMCSCFKIANAPLVMAAYWLAHHRSRLRGSVDFKS